MSVLVVALPVAILISVVFVTAFVWQMHSGQFDDLETPPRRILYDDVATGRSAPQETVAFTRLKDAPTSDQKSDTRGS